MEKRNHDERIKKAGENHVELNELEDLESKLKEFENDIESDTLIKYKKAIPKLEECLKEYDNMTIPEKNESLKSIIERITYYKTKRLNWRKKEEDDMVICIDMKL